MERCIAVFMVLLFSVTIAYAGTTYTKVDEYKGLIRTVSENVSEREVSKDDITEEIARIELQIIECDQRKASLNDAKNSLIALNLEEKKPEGIFEIHRDN